jgi:TonB family protein
VEDVEEVKQTAEEKAERRKQQREARAAKRAAAMQAARSRGIFAQAGAVSSGRRRGGGGKTLGGGGLGGVSASGLSGIARGTEIAKVEKLRGGGAITEGAGDIDISELSLEDIELILEGSSVEVEEVPEVRGAAASSAARSADAIQGVIRGETRVLKNCYNTQKKKDPNLRGRITVRFTIKADGSVSRVQVRNAEWTNRSLGRRVEQCVRQRVSRWRFDPAEGDVTTEFPLLLT